MPQPHVDPEDDTTVASANQFAPLANGDDRGACAGGDTGGLVVACVGDFMSEHAAVIVRAANAKANATADASVGEPDGLGSVTGSVYDRADRDHIKR